MTDRHHDFGNTMEGLARGLRVAEIATLEPLTVTDTDLLADVKEQHGLKGFDHLLVTSSNQIVGVLDLTSISDQDLVGQAMDPLSDWMLIASSDPIQDLVPLFRKHHYQLVVHRGKISGIVTRSDLLKLPARVLAFSLVSHLEMLMGALIIQSTQGDEWIQKLGANRRCKAVQKRIKLAEDRMDPPLIECCDFCDKRDLVKKIYEMPKLFISELKEIEELRNQIAHAADYAETDSETFAFVERLLLTSKWIDTLHERLESFA